MTADSNGYVGFDLALFIAEKLRAQFVFDMAQMEGCLLYTSPSPRD